LVTKYFTGDILLGTIPDMLGAAQNQFAEDGEVVVPGGLGNLPNR
jgi:hypothetical protein